MRMAGSRRRARAIAMRWRWPPESLTPALAHLGVVALGQELDEFVGVGRPRSLPNPRLVAGYVASPRRSRGCRGPCRP